MFSTFKGGGGQAQALPPHKAPLVRTERQWTGRLVERDSRKAGHSRLGLPWHGDAADRHYDRFN